jgi:hypothetical protein
MASGVFLWSKSWFKKLRGFIETESILEAGVEAKAEAEVKVEVEVEVEIKYGNSLPVSLSPFSILPFSISPCLLVSLSPFLLFSFIFERVKGIEPSYLAWEASVLPLNYTRNIF